VKRSQDGRAGSGEGPYRGPSWLPGYSATGEEEKLTGQFLS